MKHRPRRNYTYRSMYEERELGVCWYAGLWHVLRPVLIAFASFLVVLGLLRFTYEKVSEAYLAPPGDGKTVLFTVESGQSLTWRKQV